MSALLNRYFFKPTPPPSILEFFSLAKILFFIYSEPCYHSTRYVINLLVFVTKKVIYSFSTSRLLHLHRSFYSFTPLILWTKSYLAISSHGQINHAYKSRKNHDHYKNLGGVIFTHCNLSITESLTNVIVFVSQSHKKLLFSELNELKVPSVRHAAKRMLIHPKRELDDEQKIENDDNFRCPTRQISQPMHNCLEKTALNMKKDVSLID